MNAPTRYAIRRGVDNRRGGEGSSGYMYGGARDEAHAREGRGAQAQPHDIEHHAAHTQHGEGQPQPARGTAADNSVRGTMATTCGAPIHDD